MKKVIVLFTLLLTFSECEKEHEYSSSLIGGWEWVKSCGGLSYGCFTPQSNNYTIKLIFTADSTYESYINGTLEFSTKFQTYILPQEDIPGTANIIKYFSSNEQKFSIAHDTLFLNDFCCDGYNSIYKRTK
jgi:hypothetical protein